MYCNVPGADRLVRRPLFFSNDLNTRMIFKIYKLR